MKNLLVLGCSYSAFYYHPDPRWSYTWLLKEALEAEHIINLSYGGNSPSGVSRTLDWYLRNPIKGLPDFIYIQLPQGTREEYYISAKEWEELNEVTFINTNEVLFKGKNLNHTETGMPNVRDDRAWQDYNKYIRPGEKVYQSNKELVHSVDWNQISAIGGTLWSQKRTFDNNWLQHYLSKEFVDTFKLTSTDTINVNASWNANRTKDNSDLSRSINDFHKLWYHHKNPRSSMLNTTRREMAVIQTMVNKYNIPMVMNSTDNIIVPETGEFETWDDDTTHYDSLINWDNVIKYISISNLSKTWADDDYWDGHPGRYSHENYAKLIIPICKKIASETQ